MQLEIATPRWALPLLPPCRYKGVKGGRGSGKSHFLAELLVEEHVANPNQQSVCIREIQKSLKFSAKKLIEGKIRALGVSHLFDITLTEIRRIGHEGLIIFQGMQDHTADSIKSLEGFDRAWVEEAQSLSHRSLELLRPTIRNPGSQIWFSWNPDQRTDAVDQFMCSDEAANDPNFCVIHVNLFDNPFRPQVLVDEMERDRLSALDTFGHVWLGEYRDRTDAQIFAGKYRIGAMDWAADWDGPYHGLDWGFSQDPTAATRCWIAPGNVLYIDAECGKVGLELDDTPAYLQNALPGIADYEVIADSARPESISYVKRKGIPRCVGAVKGKGSVEDGIDHLKSFSQIVIHPDCVETAEEFRLYSYKIDKKSGQVLRDIVDKFNHYIDSLRYGLEKVMIAKQPGVGLMMPARLRRRG